MALTSLQNQFISASYGQLLQVSGSDLADGNGTYLTSSLLNISASYSSFAESSSIADSATTAGSATSALSASFASTAESASFAQTASYAANVPSIDTGSFITNVTNDFSDLTFTKGDATTLEIDATPRQVIETVKNGEIGTLAKGTPVYVSGSVGNASIVYAASASRADRMPAAYVLNEQLAADAEGEALVLGFINGVNTSTFSAGDVVYVGENGGYTNVKPTGTNLIQNLGKVIKVDVTNGSGVITGAGRANDLPNIAENYIWKGDANGVPQAVLSSSIIPTTANTASYVAAANVDGVVANATNAVTAETASFLPNSTRLNITDITASNASFTSASIGFLQSITGSAKIIGDAFIIVNNDTPTERYAGIKVIDSGSTNTTASLQYDGQTNDWFYEYEGADPTNHGVVLFGPEYGTIGSPIYPTANEIQMGDGGHHMTGSELYSDRTKVYSDLPFSSSAGFTGSLEGTASFAANSNAINAQLVSGSGFNSVRVSIPGGASSTAGGFQATALSPNSTADNVESVAIGSYATVRSNYGVGIGRLTENEIGDSPIAIGNAAIAYGNSSIALGKSAAARVGSHQTTVIGEEAQSDRSGSIIIGYAASGSGHNEILIGSASATYGDNTVHIGNDNITDTYLEGTVHAGGLSITGSATFNPTALSIVSATASMDLSTNNVFTLGLAQNADTHLDFTNPTAGQVINLQITNNAVTAGTISFAPEFKFSEGTAFVASTGVNDIDVLTLVCFDGTNLLATGLNNFE